MATEIKSTSIKSQNIIAEPQTNKPGSPEQGQIIQATGTGDIAKGIYQYSGASWVSLDNAQGDLETLRLIMSTDTDAVGFSSALNSTSTLAGNTNAVPHETSTGTGLLGALEIPSTGGDALLTEFDANKVFRYYSAGANNNNDYFGIPVDIPAQTRGQNIVIKFKYRTEEASAASSNGDFQVSVWDKTNGVSTTQASTLTTGTTIAAGSNILMTAKTNLAVGDKIWFETGTAAVNNVANGFTQAYITSISSTDNNITVSESVTVVASGIAVTGWLTSNTQGLLPAADSDTNKVGKDYSIAVKTEEDTDQVVVWFSNKSTTTNVIELFLDGILVSQNKFLQASSQTKVGTYNIQQLTSAMSNIATTMEFNLSTATITKFGDLNTLDKYLEVSNAGSTTKLTALQDCVFDVSGATVGGTSAADMAAIRHVDNSGTTTHLFAGSGYTGNSHKTTVAGTVAMKKGEHVYLALVASNAGASPGGRTAYSGTTQAYLTVSVTPQTSEAIILESQDEIFTEWTAFTPTWGGSTTPAFSHNKGMWRRVGDTIEMRGAFELSGSVPGGNPSLELPSGLSINENKLGNTSGTDDIAFAGSHLIRRENTVTYFGASTNSPGFYFDVSDANRYTTLYVSHVVNAKSGNLWTQTSWSGWLGSSDGVEWYSGPIPIQGWNANFNPLLSMPLVNIGDQTEYFFAIKDGSSTVSYGTSYGAIPYFDNEQKNTISKLGTITNTSAYGTYFTASQKVKVTACYYVYPNATNYFDLGWSKNATATEANAGVTSMPDAKRIVVNCGQYNHYNVTRAIACTILLDPGESLFPQTDKESIATGVGSVSFLVEKDLSHTNMAHIIKPAVAYITDVKAENTAGGTCTTGTWADRTLNTMKGETWFIESLSSNVFTLSAGTYKINVRAPFYRPGDVRVRLYDNTNSSGDIGGSHYGSSTEGGTSYAYYETLRTVTASTGFKIQYLAANDSGGSCLGNATDDTGENEIYTTVQIEKLK
jgi:hypothetical protein